MMRRLRSTFALVLAALVAAAAVLPAQSPTPPGSKPPVPVGTVGTTGTVTPDASASDYILGAGDKLRIEVYKDPQLSQSLQVRPDGKITMPLIGDLTAVGQTPIQLRDRIATALKEYVTNPVVTVIVVETIASNVYVMGEVNKPGPVPLQGPLTALQALAMAGGFKDFAKTGDIRILRKHANGVETIRFDYRSAIKGSKPPTYLRAGDTIIVP